MEFRYQCHAPKSQAPLSKGQAFKFFLHVVVALYLNFNKIVTKYRWDNSAIVKIMTSNVGLIEKKNMDLCRLSYSK